MSNPYNDEHMYAYKIYLDTMALNAELCVYLDLPNKIDTYADDELMDEILVQFPVSVMDYLRVVLDMDYIRSHGFMYEYLGEV